MSRRYEIEERTQLIGGFNASLTAPEANAFHEHIEAHPKMAEFRRAECDSAASQLAMCGGDLSREDQMRKYFDRVSELKKDLYAIGKAWYAELVKNDDTRKTWMDDLKQEKTTASKT